LIWVQTERRDKITMHEGEGERGLRGRMGGMMEEREERRRQEGE
jgi:hypothetical protein